MSEWWNLFLLVVVVVSTFIGCYQLMGGWGILVAMALVWWMYRGVTNEAGGNI